MSHHRDIRRLKRQHKTHLHGNKCWSAGYLLMDYLLQHPPAAGERVLEVGCGWGLASVLCASRWGCHATATDADADVFPYVQLHAAHNSAVVDTRQRAFDEFSHAELAEFDLLIAADICFWDQMVDPVFALLSRACDAGVGRIVIADPERPPFFELASRCIDTYCAEIEARHIAEPRRARGAVLVIENR